MVSNLGRTGWRGRGAWSSPASLLLNGAADDFRRNRAPSKDATQNVQGSLVGSSVTPAPANAGVLLPATMTVPGTKPAHTILGAADTFSIDAGMPAGFGLIEGRTQYVQVGKYQIGSSEPPPPDPDPNPSPTIQPPSVFAGGQLIWNDEFAGAANSKASTNWWYFNAWSVRPPNNTWRQSILTNTDSWHTGDGSLRQQARIANNTQIFTSYLITWNDMNFAQGKYFLPAAGKELYFECRCNFATLAKSSGIWCAFWLYQPDDLNNPSVYYREIDIFEYIAGASRRKWMNAAYHWASTSGGPYRNMQSDFGIDIENGWHRFGCLWRSGAVFKWYLDDVEILSRDFTEPDREMGIVVSIEYDASGANQWGLPAAERADLHQSTFPCYWDVSHVRVFERSIP